MLVVFQPTGEQVDTAFCTPQAKANGPWTYPSISTPSGYTPVQGTASGRLGVLGSGGNYITWYHGNVMGSPSPISQWKMDDATAVTDGLAAIATALSAGDAIVTIGSDGAAIP